MNFHTPEIDSSLSNIAPTPHPSISLSFTESPLFIRPNASDDSSYPSPNNTYDGILTASVPALPTSGNSTSVYWTQPSAWLRGGFRYLTISLIGGQDTEVCASNFRKPVWGGVDELNASLAHDLECFLFDFVYASCKRFESVFWVLPRSSKCEGHRKLGIWVHRSRFFDEE